MRKWMNESSSSPSAMDTNEQLRAHKRKAGCARPRTTDSVDFCGQRRFLVKGSREYAPNGWSTLAGSWARTVAAVCSDERVDTTNCEQTQGEDEAEEVEMRPFGRISPHAIDGRVCLLDKLE